MIDKIKQITTVLIRVAQKTVLTVSLTLLYFLGLGLTRMLLPLFYKKRDTNLFWHKAQGYETTLENSARQS